MKCPCCHQELKEQKCEYPNCTEPATYEAWFRQYDFSGNRTRLIQRRRVCDTHIIYSIGYKEKIQKMNWIRR